MPFRRFARRPGLARAALLTACGVWATVSLGCASSSRSSDSDSVLSGAEIPARELGPYERLGFRIEWKGLPVVSRRQTPKFLDVFGDRVVFQDSGNTMTVMDAATGRSIWAAEVDNPTSRFIGNARLGDRLLSSSDNELFVLDIRTGEILDRHRLAVVANSGPTVVGDIACFGGSAGQLLGHSLASTYKLWGYQLDGAITAKPVVVGDAVAAVSQRGEVVFVNPANGSSTGITRVFSGLANNPVAGDGTLFIAGTDQSVYAFDPQGGRQIWRVRTPYPIVDQPTFVNGRLYVHVPNEGLTAFAAGSGASLWKNPGVKGTVLGVRNGRLVVWDGSTAWLVDADRGETIDTIPLQGVHSLLMTAPVDGDLYVVMRDGWVERHSPRR